MSKKYMFMCPKCYYCIITTDNTTVLECNSCNEVLFELKEKTNLDFNSVVTCLNEKYITDEMLNTFTFEYFKCIDYGNYQEIYYSDYLLWTTEDDCREQNEDGYYIETLFDYCCKEYEKFIELLYKGIKK